MKCPFCSYSTTELINISNAFFRHYDFKTVKECGCIYKCGRCQLLFHVIDKITAVEVDNLLRSKEYSLSEQTNHTLLVENCDRPVTRSFLQAELLCRFLHSDQPSILDIGCFDGALLLEFDRRLEIVDLHGFDINQHLRSIFPKKNNMHFWSSDLGDMENSFDLICMSHSIQYIKDLPDIMKHIKRLIKNDGLLFIQVPDISKNPFSILLGDQFYYFTPDVLKNILLPFGFELSLIENNWFPREIVGLATFTPKKIHNGYFEDSKIYSCVHYLEESTKRLRKLKTTARLGVLGTAVNAAFVDSVLGEKVVFFADENNYRVNSDFRNKEVLHPRCLDDSDLLIIPYGEASLSIKKRFENQYRGQFVCL
ncbi:MAG: class I SAM-dependent methyltransferase [Candidatus Aminicenantaceae bacterium]